MQNFDPQNSDTGYQNPAPSATRTAPSYEQAYAAQASADLQRQMQAGARWFFWIAGLSLVNSVISLVGGNWSFIAGLGVTQIIDVLARDLSSNGGATARVMAFIFDLLTASVFVLFGIFAGKRMMWAFTIGMIIYTLDALLFLLGMDILAIAFHGYALFCLFRGLRACQQLNRMSNPY